jgi:hypothetical protein
VVRKRELVLAISKEGHVMTIGMEREREEQ